LRPFPPVWDKWIYFLRLLQHSKLLRRPIRRCKQLLSGCGRYARCCVFLLVPSVPELLWVRAERPGALRRGRSCHAICHLSGNQSNRRNTAVRFSYCLKIITNPQVDIIRVFKAALRISHRARHRFHSQFLGLGIKRLLFHARNDREHLGRSIWTSVCVLYSVCFFTLSLSARCSCHLSQCACTPASMCLRPCSYIGLKNLVK